MKFYIKKIVNLKYKIAIWACVLVLVLIFVLTFFTSVSNRSTPQYVYIDDDDTVDSVFRKVEAAAGNKRMAGFKALVRYSNYGKNIHTGRYVIEPGSISFTLFRRFRNGQQVPISLTIPSVRTLDKLSSELASKLMCDSAQFFSAFTDKRTLQQYGCDSATIMCLFVPNTYEVFWNISPEQLVARMRKESDNFWNADRRRKAGELNLSREEVVTLASIIEEETANDAEKPCIAGLYYNRLLSGMPLQADPTVKYALKDFSIKRLYKSYLDVDSPYNTYKHEGLPPGPIRIPTIKSVDAVLNMEHHSFLYMCAKEDFSGTHNFATTYSEHLQNAYRYAKALDERRIK